MFHHINLCCGTVGSASMTREQGDMRRFKTWSQHLLNNNLVVSAETFVKEDLPMAFITQRSVPTSFLYIPRLLRSDGVLATHGQQEGVLITAAQ